MRWLLRDCLWESGSARAGLSKNRKVLDITIGIAYSTLAIMFVMTYFGEWAEISRSYYYEPYLNALAYAEELPCDTYYITPKPQGLDAENMGEILVLYAHDIDAHYFQGVTNIQNGAEVRPYSERYHFQDVTEELIKQKENEDTVYIVKAPEIELFSKDKYDIVSFYDAYYVVRQKKTVKG